MSTYYILKVLTNVYTTDYPHYVGMDGGPTDNIHEAEQFSSMDAVEAWYDESDSEEPEPFEVITIIT